MFQSAFECRFHSEWLKPQRCMRSCMSPKRPPLEQRSRLSRAAVYSKNDLENYPVCCRVIHEPDYGGTEDKQSRSVSTGPTGHFSAISSSNPIAGGGGDRENRCWAPWKSGATASKSAPHTEIVRGDLIGGRQKLAQLSPRPQMVRQRTTPRAPRSPSRPARSLPVSPGRP